MSFIVDRNRDFSEKISFNKLVCLVIQI
jgi:hypothetical protein